MSFGSLDFTHLDFSFYPTPVTSRKKKVDTTTTRDRCDISHGRVRSGLYTTSKYGQTEGVGTHLESIGAVFIIVV